MTKHIDMDWAFKQLEGRSVIVTLVKVATRLRIDAGRFIEVLGDTEANWEGDTYYLNSDPVFFWSIQDTDEAQVLIDALTYLYGEPVKKGDGTHATFFVMRPLTRKDIFALADKGVFTGDVNNNDK